MLICLIYLATSLLPKSLTRYRYMKIKLLSALLEPPRPLPRRRPPPGPAVGRRRRSGSVKASGAGGGGGASRYSYPKCLGHVSAVRCEEARCRPLGAALSLQPPVRPGGERATHRPASRPSHSAQRASVKGKPNCWPTPWGVGVAPGGGLVHVWAVRE